MPLYYSKCIFRHTNVLLAQQHLKLCSKCRMNTLVVIIDIDILSSLPTFYIFTLAYIRYTFHLND